jgi:hypothetical protein
MSRKVFTAGEVLAAADVNSFLMDQTVMSFAGTAARGSAIPSPVEGMTTYLEDSDTLQIFDGTTYASPFDYSLVTTTTFSTQSAVSFNNVFTSKYDNYIIIASIKGDGVAQALTVRLRSGGSDISTPTYNLQTVEAAATSITTFRDAGQTSWAPAAVRNFSNRLFLNIIISNPAVASLQTQFQSNGYDGGIVGQRNGYGDNSTTGAADGISFIASNNITGYISIYGLRK